MLVVKGLDQGHVEMQAAAFLYRCIWDFHVGH